MASMTLIKAKADQTVLILRFLVYEETTDAFDFSITKHCLLYFHIYSMLHSNFSWIAVACTAMS